MHYNIEKEDSEIIVHRKYNLLTQRKISYENVVPKSFKTLPVSILVKIFNYTPKNDLLKRVSLVCKHWRYAAMHPSFIRSFYISGSDVSLPYIFDHLRKFTLLETLYFEKVNNISAILLQAEKLKLNVKKLGFKSCNGLDGNLMKYILLAFPNLVAFELENTHFQDASMRYSSLSDLKCLRKLNLSKINNISMRDLLETVLNLRCLEELTIGLLPPQVNLRDQDAILIISNLAPHLKHLSIDAHSLTSRTFEKLTECAKLESLFINYGVNLNGTFLIDFMSCLPRLVRFGFTHNCMVTGRNIFDVFSGGTDFSDITYLDFTFCVLLNDEGIEAIAKCCKKLETILLKSCRSLTSIDKLCRKCKELRVLNIAFCVQIKVPFRVPHKLEKITLHEGENFNDLYAKLRAKRLLRVYKALSEYTDEIIRI